ncbi:unnamed protein product [Spirodela intermedia]|uniref:Uncharacterized protein n=1 Tax=Spirodela intermedia TaxID=51605 RepID=A0A7I8IHX2_SPIIN|nr:unnamed protein product [Spirodela intermedia]CAA6656976.1 unnamed protein product [Spirodela intermedia]
MRGAARPCTASRSGRQAGRPPRESHRRTPPRAGGQRWRWRRRSLRAPPARWTAAPLRAWRKSLVQVLAVASGRKAVPVRWRSGSRRTCRRRKRTSSSRSWPLSRSRSIPSG